ncbi:MAG TPA: hypothetical protein VG537_11985 [Candidatus Kapabacteria bacterium]|jgi:hypothetical protein|nr:hypothetical protein [Candidatus Kapabacteria bacterium]
MGAHYAYTQDAMDTAGPTTHKDQRDSSNRDHITSTVINTNASFGNKTGVVEIENVHTIGSRDTVRGYQESGNLYVWNYGTGSLLGNPLIVAYTGHAIDIGWVLQSKLNASAGTTWRADSTSIPITYSNLNGNLVTVDMATEQQDTTVIISGKQMEAKHSHHTITATIYPSFGGNFALATVPVDTYVTVEEGLVLNILHSFTISVPLSANIQVEGLYTAMTSF